MKVETAFSHNTMKTYLLLISLSAFCLHGQTVEKSTPADAATLYNNGLNAIANGNVVEGEANLRAVLKLQPDNPNAKYQLNYLILQLFILDFFILKLLTKLLSVCLIYDKERLLLTLHLLELIKSHKQLYSIGFWLRKPLLAVIQLV